MARTRGAKDRRLRKGAKPKGPGKPAGDKRAPQTQAAAIGQPDTSTLGSGDTQFQAAVEAVLGPEFLSRGNPSPPPGGVASPKQGAASTGSPAAMQEDMVLGFDAWQAIVEAPFRSLAIWLQIPEFERLGKLRAKMLSQPSYPLYRHYVTQWLTDNPDDELFIAKVMTGAALVTVLQEGWMIWVEECQRRAAAARAGEAVRTVHVDALHTDN